MEYLWILEFLRSLYTQ